MPDSPPVEGLDPLAAGLRADDPDRFYTALLAPEALRPRLFALYALNQEIARTRERVREPMLGQIRLQWWRETLDETLAGTPRRHPVAEALAGWFSQSAPDRATLMALVDAREHDLDDAPFATTDSLVTYLDGTGGALLRLGLDALGVDSAAARTVAHHAGRAYALAGLVRAIPFHGAAGRVMLPADLLAGAGIADPRMMVADRDPKRMRAVVAGLVDLAAGEAAAARKVRGVPRAARPVLAHLGLAELYLSRIRRAGHDLADPRLDPGNGVRIARLLWRNLTGRY
ncbi:MAG: squalene/phytoene synthase family protein [Pseudomonadota bacterium]|nr:squalene/phytoene synthase family protein [Pseudomonadota bacterium]